MKLLKVALIPALLGVIATGAYCSEVLDICARVSAEKAKLVDMKAVLTITNHGEGKPTTSVFDYTIKSNGYMKMKKAGEGSVSFNKNTGEKKTDDGKGNQSYYKAQKQVKRIDNDDLQGLLTDNDASLMSESKGIAEIELTPKNSNMKLMKRDVTVDTEKNVVTKIVFFGPDGNKMMEEERLELSQVNGVWVPAKIVTAGWMQTMKNGKVATIKSKKTAVYSNVAINSGVAEE